MSGVKDIKDLKPTRNSRYQQGYINPKTCKKLFKGLEGTAIIYRSSYEKKLIGWFENSSQVENWGSECIRVPYLYIDEKTHYYYPDYLVKKTNGEMVLIEVKPHNQTQKPVVENTWAWEQWTKNMCKWKATKEMCDRRGWKFLILTEKTINKI